jgi:hypothetical protein
MLALLDNFPPKQYASCMIIKEYNERTGFLRPYLRAL